VGPERVDNDITDGDSLVGTEFPVWRQQVGRVLDALVRIALGE
jgi:hypothetical protein